MKLLFEVAFVISLIIMFSSVTSAWIMYLRYRKQWMKQYVMYAIVWAVGIIQTGLLYLQGMMSHPENQKQALLLCVAAVFVILFIFEQIAPPYLLFSFSDTKISKRLKLAIIINPFLTPLLLVFIFAIIYAAEFQGSPESLLHSLLPIIISCSEIISLGFQITAFIKILKTKRKERGIIIFVLLTFAYQIITLIFSAQPVPWKIPIGIYGYNLGAVIFTITAYTEFMVFSMMKLSRDFSGKARKVSSAAVDEFGLTLRETDIANLLLTGLNSREIGEKLFITKKTVDTHIYNIYKKCGVKNKLEFFNLTG